MKSLLVEVTSTNRCITGEAASDIATAPWLAMLLAAYEAEAVSSAEAADIESRLKTTTFEAVVTAIEDARPALAGHAEIRLYQAWIAANMGTGKHLFVAWFNLGATLAREGDPNRAALAYGNALELNSTFYPAAINLGLSLETIGQTDAALRAWESATQTSEARTALLNQKGRLLEGLGRLAEAEAALYASILTNPEQPDAVQHWLHIRQKICQWPVLPANIPGLPQTELARHSGPLGVLALTDDVNVQREVTGSWIARKMPPAPVRLSPAEGYRHDRIRIGYLSSDFCRHAMSYLIAELFERHDRSRFEIFGYCSTLEDGSDIRKRVIAGFDHHRIIRDLSDEQAAKVIRDDEIDILIDLNGLTARTRLAVMRWRPAPIQATYLGFIGPVDLPELDYLLCDDFVVPAQQAAAYSPTPLTIAYSYQANDSKRAIGRALSRQDVGLPDDCFVFCCFSNHYKITEALFAGWMAILRGAERSVLWLAIDNGWSPVNLRAYAAREGVAPDRILFADRTSPESYMRRLALADLFLDTFPYNAGTVASDAIRMQLPLLTLCGASFASRMAGSLLNTIGARMGITTSLPEYVATAIKLATDADAYASYKQQFAGDTWKQTAGDIARFTAEFESTLAQLVTVTPSSRAITHVSGPCEAAADSCQPKSDVEDLGIIDLVSAAERMAGAGKIEAALALYELWLTHHPVDRLRHVAYFNLGTLLIQISRPTQAVAAFAEASRLKPAFLPAYVNAGLAYERLGQLDLAVGQWLQAADRVVPVDETCISNKTTALKNLARVYKSVGNVASAEEALRRCLAIDPSQRDAVQHWIALRQMQCKWPVILPWGKQTMSSLMAILSPLTVAIHTDDPMYQMAHAWNCFGQDMTGAPMPCTVGRWVPPTPAAGPRHPLRIGYVSPDLREHAVGFLTAELFGLHDRAKVEVFAYYSGRPEPDAMQARIRQTVDHWKHIAGQGDKAIAKQIVSDEIDILIDLGGHTGDSPTAAFALRPAPVIVNWLGFPGSMGTPHHQYIIADEMIIPPAYEKCYSERVVRLPCYQPTDRKRIVGEPTSRRDVGLRNDAIVYCCFNGPQKITPVMFRCWMAILSRVPNAVLWLLSCDAATDQRLRQQAIALGISPDRLVFATRKLNAEHLARYSLADLFLDTSPYGAHTTASDALWMGVPVLTMAGHSFASRVCSSLVHAAGLPELLCDTHDAYVERAVALGNQPEVLIALRKRLQAGRDHCTLFDMNLLVTRLEGLYEQMWNEFLSGQGPEPNLTNLGIYNEIGNELDHEMAEALDRPSYEQRYKAALTYRNNISPLPFDQRLWIDQR